MNRASFIAVLVTGMVCLVGITEVAQAEIPQTISYQGKVTDTAGNPVADGTYTMRFRIYDAATAGTLEWDSGAQTVVLSNGVFNVVLGESPQPALDLSFDEDYWLLVRFAGVDQTPRQQLTANGYSYMASGLVPGTEIAGDLFVDGKLGIGTTSPPGPLAVAVGSGLIELSTPSGVPGIIGFANNDHRRDIRFYNSGMGIVTSSSNAMPSSTNGIFIGENGRVGIGTTSPDLSLDAQNGDATYTGIEMTNTHGSQRRWALLSNSNSYDYGPPKGFGIRDVSVYKTRFVIDTDGHVGVGTLSPSTLLHVVSDTSSAIFGQSNATSGGAYGVTAYSTAPSGGGVYGHAGAYEGPAYGVYGKSSSSTGGHGVYGHATASQGATYGVYGKSDSSTGGYGVYGEASATTPDTSNNMTYGVYGRSRSPAGVGVYGFASASSGVTYGGFFKNYSPWGIGVKGFAAATTQGESYGGWFSSNGLQGIGVYAIGGVEGYAGVFRGNVAIKSYTSGSIVLELGEGLDYAEGFDVAGGDAVTPGTVLIIDETNTGRLAKSYQPYDTRVAGIVAGANGIGSGVRLGAGEFDHSVALAGRVYCNVDATAEGVVPGDLLTTSPMPGYAMKATDHSRARGAILGKAMEPLARGHKGQILVLVTLQ
jgi:hypothetical protein